MTIAFTDKALSAGDNKADFEKPDGSHGFISSLGAHPGTGEMTYQAIGMRSESQHCVVIVFRAQLQCPCPSSIHRGWLSAEAARNS
jgi:hypothetical protein